MASPAQPDPSTPQRRAAIDFSTPVHLSSLNSKTILITGGASGVGAALFTRWATAGATVIIGDVNTSLGTALVARTRRETSNPNLHFVSCDVTSWASQVAFFREAVSLSPLGGVDVVVANAGVPGDLSFDEPQGLDAADPPPPDLKAVEVDLLGVLYTAHLALWYLPRNKRAASRDIDKGSGRDAHLLLIGSAASLLPFPGQTLYGVAKHGVLGLFRALRISQPASSGVRVNILCPYFIETPFIDATARLFLAGFAKVDLQDVVDAATRLVADSELGGRCLVVGPRERDGKDAHVAAGIEGAVWEALEGDLEDFEPFGRRMVRLLNARTAARGWLGWAGDVLGALSGPFWSLLGVKRE